MPPNGRPHKLSGIRMFHLLISLPKLRPEIVLNRMQRRITGQDSAAELPFIDSLDQFRTQRILQDITNKRPKTRFGGAPSPSAHDRAPDAGSVAAQAQTRDTAAEKPYG